MSRTAHPVLAAARSTGKGSEAIESTGKTHTKQRKVVLDAWPAQGGSAHFTARRDGFRFDLE
jgi:hypothetical protein